MIRCPKLPEPPEHIPHITYIHSVHMLPLSGKKQPVFTKHKTVVQKKYHTLVLSGPKHSSGRLQDFIHTRKTVSIVKASLFPGSITNFYSLTFLAVFGLTASANCDLTIA